MQKSFITFFIFMIFFLRFNDHKNLLLNFKKNFEHILKKYDFWKMISRKNGDKVLRF